MRIDGAASLLPPYNTLIDSWRTYYEERSALEDLNKSERREAHLQIALQVAGENSIELLQQARQCITRVLRAAALWDGARDAYPRSAGCGLYLTKLSSNSPSSSVPDFYREHRGVLIS